jgi:hypothetical protein
MKTSFCHHLARNNGEEESEEEESEVEELESEVEESEVITNPLVYFKNLYNTIAVEREVIKESFLQNQIDTVEELINSTVYKLKFLN